MATRITTFTNGITADGGEVENEFNEIFTNITWSNFKSSSAMVDIDQDFRFDNNIAIQFENSSGTADAYIKMNTSNHLEIKADTNRIYLIADGGFIEVRDGQILQVNDSANTKSFQISHDGTDAKLESGSGDINLIPAGGDIKAKNAAKFIANSAGDDKNVQLYHDDTNGVLAVSGGDMTITENFYPSADNTYKCGIASKRWSDVRSVLINGADVGFENDWKFREYPCSADDVQTKSPKWMKENANKGIQLLDDRDNVIAVFTREGIYGEFKSLKELKDK